MRNPQKQKIKLESVKDKSTLVKLLAEEDLTVSYQKVSTASFNPNTREVVLPIWKDKSESVMDMMSLHEVGHALYTPLSLLEDGQNKKVKHSFLNVLEDVRIEKMIQDKYLGSRKVFKTAYTELLEKDFFNIKGKDLSKLNLIDRINMHYKNVPNVPFDNDELEWVQKANETKTSDDVLNLAIELQEWMYANQKETESDDMFKLDIAMPDEKSEDTDGENSESDDSNSSEDGDQESEDTNGSGDSDSDSDSDSEDEKDSDDKSDDGKSSENVESDDKQEQKIKGYSKGSGGEDFDGIEAMTDTNYQKKQYDSVDQNATEIEYLNIPKINLKEVIIDYKDVNKELSEHYSSKTQGREYNQKYMDFINKDIVKFKNEQKSTISYMVKEFEMKKAADLYKRSTVSKTGSLNMDKLHSYSYNEDIFLKMNVEPGATNHGLVMFVDWSGSMHENFYNTIKQTLNLVWFCERVNIPFEVYGFTNGYGRSREDSNKHIHAQKRKQDDMIINELTLLNMLSSRANKKDMQEGLVNLWAYAHYYGSQNSQTRMPEDKYGYSTLYPVYPASDYQLYSTPLNHSIVAAMDLVPKFKKDNGLQKVHTVFLTDGASNSIDKKYEFTMQDSRPYREQYDSNDKHIPLPDDYQGTIMPSSISVQDKTLVVTDPVTKKKWIEKKVESRNGYYYSRFSYSTQTEILLSFLKERLPEMSITNFFIASRNRKGTLSKNDIASIFGLSTWDDEDKIKSIQKEILKNNVAVCKTGGWDEMYVLPGGKRLDVSDDNMSEITPGTAKTGELKKAFSKMSSGRKNSRPLLNKFIGMIA